MYTNSNNFIATGYNTFPSDMKVLWQSPYSGQDFCVFTQATNTAIGRSWVDFTLHPSGVNK